MPKLLQGTIDVNALTYSSKFTALHLAAFNDNVIAAEILLKSKADIEVPDWFQMTPLCRAVYEESLRISHLLVEKGANVMPSVECRPFADVKWNSPIPFLQMLLGRGANINSFSTWEQTQLMRRVDNEDEETVRWLLDNGALPNLKPERGKTALAIACERGSESLVRLLLDRGAHVNHESANPQSPLVEACISGYAEIAEILLDHGGSPNAATSDGDTLLHLAIKPGHGDCCHLLLARGANVNAVNKDGRTPLMLAIQRMFQLEDTACGKYREIICNLLHACAKPDMQDLFGATALHLAIANGE